MTGAQQTHAAAALEERGRCCIHLKGELGAREDKIECRERVVVLLDGALVHGYLSRERSEDTLDLGLFAALEHLDLVVDLNDLLRLDEHGSAGGRGVVHQTRHVAAVLGLDRHDEAAVSLGDDGLLEVLGALARDHAVERLTDPAGDAAQLAANGEQLGGRAVRDLLLGDNGGSDGLLEAAVAREQAEDRRERALFLALRLVGKRAARGLQKARHAQQLARIERAAAVGADEDRADLTDAAEGRAALPHHAVLRVRGLAHPQLRLLAVVQRPKRAAFFLGRLRGRLRGQPLEYFVIFQCFQGLFA